MFNKFLLGVFILSVIRWERGADWKNYIDLFYKHYDGFEKGFTELNIYISNYFGEYIYLLVLQGFIIFICLKNFFKYSLNKNTLCIGFFIYYSIYLGNIYFVRQSVALALSMYSLKILNKSKIIFYLINFLAAYFFHMSALAFLIVPLILNLKNTKDTKLYLLILVLLSPLYEIIFLKGISIVGLIIPRITEKLLSYSVLSSQLNYLSYLNKYVIIIIIYLFYKNDFDKKYNDYFKIYMFGNLITLSLLKFSADISRIGNSFIFLEIILIANIINKLKKNEYKIIYFLFIGCYYYLRFFLNSNRYLELYIPFKTIFNKGIEVILY
ncbi:MAG: EpsG family protein [Fusobacteriaceae bacterium]